MGELTPRRGMYLPGGGSTGLIVPDEVADIDRLNENFRKIDSMLGARVLPSASSYTDSYDGDLVYAEDTELLKMYSSNAGKLIDPRVLGGNAFKGTKAQRDAFTGAEKGDLWRLTDDTGYSYEYTGTKWRPLISGLVPVVPASVSAAVGTATVDDHGVITYTTASDIRLLDVFTDEFQDYLFTYQVLSASQAATVNIAARFGKAGAIETTAIYFRAGVVISGAGASTNLGSMAGVDHIIIGNVRASWFPVEGTFEIKGPARSDGRSHMTGQGMGISGNDFGVFNVAGVLNKNDAMSDLQITPGNGTITGTMRVFGYSK